MADLKFTRGPGRKPSIKKSWMLLILMVLFTLLLIYSFLTSKQKNSPIETYREISKDDEIVYCVMVTHDVREQYMLHSVQNFKEQDYTNKRLIIVSETRIQHPLLNDPRILQVPVQRKGSNVSLGKLRNIAFELIPERALFTVWDDDDIRSTDYISTLKSNLGDNDFLMFSKRIEYNSNTNFAWIMELKPGFVLFFGRKLDMIKYDNVNVNEDVHLRHVIKTRYKSKVIDNDPKLYIRISHDNNTSRLVNNRKTNLKDTASNRLYFEHQISEADQEYTRMKIAHLNSFVNQGRGQ